MEAERCTPARPTRLDGLGLIDTERSRLAQGSTKLTSSTVSAAAARREADLISLSEVVLSQTHQRMRMKRVGACDALICCSEAARHALNASKRCFQCSAAQTTLIYMVQSTAAAEPRGIRVSKPYRPSQHPIQDIATQLCENSPHDVLYYGTVLYPWLLLDRPTIHAATRRLLPKLSIATQRPLIKKCHVSTV